MLKTHPASPWRRYRTWAVWLVCVILVHIWAGQELGKALDAWRHTPPEPDKPANIQVVDLIKPSAPPLAPTPPTAPAPSPPQGLSSPPAEITPSPPVASNPEVLASAASSAMADAGAMTSDITTASGPAASMSSVTPTSRPDPAASVSAQEVWPPSFRIQYKLEGHYKGHFTGQAYIVWLRDADRYRVELDVQVGALLSHHLMSEGRLSMTGLIPERFAENRRLLFQRKKQQLQFEPTPHEPQAITVLLPDGTRRAPAVGVQDPASQFVQLAWLFATQPQLLAQGQHMSFPLASFRRSDVWTYQVGETVMVQTPLGEVAATHAKPQREVEPMPGNLQVELWFAPSLRFLPVRLRVQDGNQAQADMMIDGLPQLLGPVKLRAVQPQPASASLPPSAPNPSGVPHHE